MSDDVSSIREEGKSSDSKQKAKEHVKELERLKEKDPEFYQYLQEHDKELLEFNDEDIDDEDPGTDVEKDPEPMQIEDKLPQKVITTTMVDSWCRAIEVDGRIGAVRSLLQAFRTACHHGDDGDDGSSPKFNIISSGVFNKIMVFVLNKMDGILRDLLTPPAKKGTVIGKKEAVMELMKTQLWKKYDSLIRLYLGNALHILMQMTDEHMISFTLKRVKASAVFLVAFPTLLRKYIKVAIHSWATGKGALPVVAFLFLRDLCVRLGSDCYETCLKGVYKAFVLNCKLSKSISRSKLQHIQFLINCVTELYGVDPPAAYQHVFLYIRQLAEVLRGALTERGPKVLDDKKKGKKHQENSSSSKQHVMKAYQKVYDWQFIFCLELWTRVICAYNSEADFRPLAYPLTQIIYGVACLVPTSRYFSLRVRCIKMLNRIAEATGTFIPVSSLLLEMLEMKELNKPPAGGVGKGIDLLKVKQVDKNMLKTRAFQESCIYCVIEELAEHLAQWSYSVAFFELSFIPLVRMRSFCKSTKADRFRREMKELIRQVEMNCEFTNSRRMKIDFAPNDPAAALFMKDEKESGVSPLSNFIVNLRLRARQRADAMDESSVRVGAESSAFVRELPKSDDEASDDNGEEGAAVFNSSWFPEGKSKVIKEKKSSKKKRTSEEQYADGEEDLVEAFVLSSDEEGDGDGDGDDDDIPGDDSPLEEEEDSARKKSRKDFKKRKLDSSQDQDNNNKFSKKRKPRRKKAKKDASL